MQLIVLLFIIQLCVISTLPCSNTLRLLFRTLDSWQINVQWYAFETKPQIFLVGIYKFENGETVLNSSVSLFSHWRKLGSLLGDEKRGSHHLSIVNLPISSILKANKTNSKVFPPFIWTGWRQIVTTRVKANLCKKIYKRIIVKKIQMNDSFCGWWVCGNDGKTKWKWKCFMVHCVTLGECLVSGASGPWGNHWSMVGLGGKGAIGYANGKEIIICKLFLSKLLPWVFQKLQNDFHYQHFTMCSLNSLCILNPKFGGK